MGRNRGAVVETVAGVVAIAVALVAGTAQAKSWEEWAPAPLASDSSHAALTSDERAWLVAESEAQRTDQLTPRIGVNPLGLVLTGAIVGPVAVIAALRKSQP